MKVNYLKNNVINTWEFLRGTKAYFKDVLLIHGLLLFIVIPTLASSTRFILRRGAINYLSYDSIPIILKQHPVVLISLVIVLLLIVFTVFFEFTFLLISVYFIKKEQPIGSWQLLRMTFLQLKKVRISTCLFFLFYFFLVLPISGFSFNSDLLSKIKIPAFIMDYIFANRVIVIVSFIALYLLLIYLGIRLIFALPEMILRDLPFKQAVKESWQTTKKKFFAIAGRFVFIGGTVLLMTSVSFSIILFLQMLVENHWGDYALQSAVLAMTMLQFTLLVNLILSTVSIFFIIVDFMNDEGFLPDIPEWFYLEKAPSNEKWGLLKGGAFLLTAGLFGVGVGTYNTHYLTSATISTPVTISHRGVTENNGVQNSIAALEKTAKLKPLYVEMDVQETKDKQFVVFHDFSLKPLTGTAGKPSASTLNELTALTAKENQQEEAVVSFDDYLAAAKQLHQKLLIEIKTPFQENPGLVDNFLSRYQTIIEEEGHTIQSLNFDIVQEIKHSAPHIQVGYILPFNIIGPPVTDADFLTMEYSTINRNFIESAHLDNKEVYVWTVNDEDAMDRMMFYGVDGIITDNLATLNKAVRTDVDELTYSDKLLYFVIGVG